MAGRLRRDLHPHPRHPHRPHPVPGLPLAGHHRAVRDVHRDLLRHPDHLGARRRRAHQTHGDPHPRAALVAAKAFASGAKAVVQAVVVLIMAALLGAGMTYNPLKLLCVLLIVVLGSGFFSCLSMSIAGIVLTRDRLMGIGQAITMPLFFTSSALYPISVMPGWLQPLSRINPLTYEVDGLRSLLIGSPTDMPLNLAVLAGSTLLAVTVASKLLPRLAKG
ncbi:ABC transporter permease [Actinospica durhamensis]|uniref:Transport permease protein n=1 Tax=Actinospica durhamensis TaxID=1508375 RepID=A0A941EQA1_9ACTN|nr:ABC transporter permease [Actinospica durhamensis]